MPSITVPTALAVAGGVSAAGGVASAVIGGNAAEQAAQTQAQAADSASQATLNMFNSTQKNLSPYATTGVQSLNALSSLIGTNPGGNPLTAPLTAPFQPTQAQLAATPGYQFTLNQGLQATQNSYAAQGLGQSGAALKGAANYAEGLAGTTYQQQFGNYLSQNQQIYNMLGGQASLGENAAATSGNQGLTAQNQANQLTTSAAAAGAAGTIGAANAASSGIGSLTSGASNTALLLALSNSGMFGGASGGSAAQYNALTPTSDPGIGYDQITAGL